MTGETPHLLIVDDDARLRDLLRRYLAANGMKVSVAASAAEARASLAALAFDALVLDVMMPGETGTDLCRSLRAAGGDRLPVLMLTALGESRNRIEGLESGADDYLTKPFEPRELLLRIHNLLRRAPPPPAAAEVRLGRCLFDPARQTLTCDGAPVHLTTAEAGLLTLLARHAHAILSREDLIAQGGGNLVERSMDVQIARLRRKIEDDPRFPRYLHTVRGKGYVLRPD